MWYSENNTGRIFHPFIITFSTVSQGLGFPSMHWAKGREPPCIGRQSITVRTHTAVLCVKRKVSVDPCWPSVYSAESGPISLGINAQHGTSILPAVQRPRDSLSQPLPFTGPCPLSVSLRHSQKDSISPPPVTLLKLLLAGALLCEPLSYRLIPLRTPWHKDSDDDQRSIRRKEVQEEEEDNGSGPEKTTAATAALSFQHLFHAECSSRSVHGMGTTEPTRFCIFTPAISSDQIMFKADKSTIRKINWQLFW